MEIIVICCLVVGITAYCSCLVWLIIGLKKGAAPQVKHSPYVTIIIAARNEEKNVRDCLLSIKKQQYIGQWEVILVDDRSTDNTNEIATALSSKWARLRIISADDPPRYRCPKKSALTCGIESAQGDILLFTDADCIVPVGWIQSMVAHFLDGVGFVAGHAHTQSGETLIQKTLSVENAAIGALGAGSFAQGNPLSCTGRNLAYRKSVFFEIDGFEDSKHLVGGDDVYLMRSIKRRTQWQFAFNRNSVVVSKPAPSDFKSILQQKLRHASKGGHYQGPVLGLAVIIYLFHASFFVSFFLWILCGKTGGWGLMVWTFRWVVDAMLFRAFKVVDNVPWPRILPFLEVLYIPYVVLLAVIGRLGFFSWKK